MPKKVLLISLCVLVHFPVLAQKPYENPSVPSVNALPAHAYYKIYKSMGEQETGQSSHTMSLNGDWDFKLVSGKENIPETFYQSGFDTSDWHQLLVPSNWQVHGHGFPVYSNYTLDMEPDEVGLYKTTFELPNNWKKGRVILHFEAVKTAFHVYCNGKEIGYQEGAYLPSEFDITPHLADGKNHLSVAVYRIVDTQPIENFDTWRLSGIFRDVSLIYRPSTYVHDITTMAKTINNYKDGEWRVEAELLNHGGQIGKGTELEVRLLDNQDRIVARLSQAVGRIRREGKKTITFQKTIPDILPWTAETPNLYKTIISLKNGQQVFEVLELNTGFRTIEIIDEQLKVNGQKIYLKGVNRHDWHPDMGRAITKEVMRRDFEFFKKYNINAIRTSHYPNHSHVYDLADQYGIYVMDEAALETHWVTHAEKMDGWREAHLHRARRLVERDKNHPSVILWSMGNEFFEGPHTRAMYDWVAKTDPSRPIYFDGRDTDSHKEDYGNIQAAAYNDFKTLTEKSMESDKPVIMKEYFHAAGNEMGSFGQFWDTIRNPKYPNLHGGFIWDFKDQGWSTTTVGGQKFYDWGQYVGVAPTGNDGFDGITNTDMEEIPKALEVAKVFQNVAVKPMDVDKGKFTIVNRHHFASLDHLEGKWTLSAEGEEIGSGILNVNNIKAGSEKQVQLHLSPYRNQHPLKEMDVLFSFRLKKEWYGLPADHLVAWEQLVVQKKGAPEKIAAKGGSLQVKESAKSIWIHTDGNHKFRFNTQLGRLISWRIGEKEILDRTQGPVLNLWRATTDGDNSEWGGLQSKYYWPWKRAGLDDPEFLKREVIEFKWVRQEGNQVIFDVFMKISANKETIAHVDYRYTLLADGRMLIGVNFKPQEILQKISGLPRLGLTAHLNPTWNRVNWYGEGPHENYRDRNRSSWVGHHGASVDELYTPYVSPQANGNRSGIRWLQISDGEDTLRIIRLSEGITEFLPQGTQLQAPLSPYFEFTAIPYTEHELDRALYDHDLPQSNRTVLTLDHEHAGVASHPRPGRQPEHEVVPVPKSFVFLLQPSQ